MNYHFQIYLLFRYQYYFHKVVEPLFFIKLDVFKVAAGRLSTATVMMASRQIIVKIVVLFLLDASSFLNFWKVWHASLDENRGPTARSTQVRCAPLLWSFEHNRLNVLILLHDMSLHSILLCSRASCTPPSFYLTSTFSFPYQHLLHVWQMLRCSPANENRKFPFAASYR